MKVLHIIPNLKKGGAERLVLTIAEECKQRPGIDMCIVSLSNDNHYTAISKHLFVKVIPAKVIPSITGKTITILDELDSFIGEYKPDVIHSHLFESEIVTRWKLFPGVKYISHCHDNMKQLAPFQFSKCSKQQLTNIYEKRILFNQYKKCNNTFISISKHTSDFFEKVLPKSLQKRIYLLPNAIDFNKFNKQTIDRHESKTIKLINVGLIVPKKNQQFLIKVVEGLILKRYSVTLTLLGDGYESEAIKKEIQKAGLTEIISMPGNVDNVEDYLAQSTIYVHSALYEPFGLVLLEAMAASLPVVCLDGGGNRDIIENGKNGFIIKDQNVDEFVERILELHNNQNLYTEISSYAQQYAKQYDIKLYVDKLLEIYQKAPVC